MSERDRPLSWGLWLRRVEERAPEAAQLARRIAADRPNARDLADDQRDRLDALVTARLAYIAADGGIRRTRKSGMINDQQHAPAA